MSAGRTEASVLRKILDARAAEIHTAIPGQVVNYDASKQIADVQPMVKDYYYSADGALRTRSFPVLPSVPVQFPRGGGYFVSFPLSVGDTGMLIFSELPIDRWRSTGQEAHPVNARRHGAGNAVFYPGLTPRAKALTDDGVDANLIVGKEGGAQIHVSADMVNVGEKNAADFVALALKVQTEFATIKTALISAFNAIGASTAANGALGAASLSSGYTPGSVAATKVKAT